MERRKPESKDVTAPQRRTGEKNDRYGQVPQMHYDKVFDLAFKLRAFIVAEKIREACRYLVQFALGKTGMALPEGSREPVVKSDSGDDTLFGKLFSFVKDDEGQSPDSLQGFLDAMREQGDCFIGYSAQGLLANNIPSPSSFFGGLLKGVFREADIEELSGYEYQRLNHSGSLELPASEILRNDDNIPDDERWHDRTGFLTYVYSILQADVQHDEDFIAEGRVTMRAGLEAFLKEIGMEHLLDKVKGGDEAVTATVSDSDPLSRMRSIDPDKYPSKREAREALVEAVVDFWNQRKAEGDFNDNDFVDGLFKAGLPVESLGLTMLMVKTPEKFYDVSELHVSQEGQPDQESGPDDGILIFPDFRRDLRFSDFVDRGLFVCISGRGQFEQIASVAAPAMANPRYLWDKGIMLSNQVARFLSSKGSLM